MRSVRDLVAPEPTPPEPFTGTPWWDLPIVGFDLETDSPEPEHARIVSAAVVQVGGGQPRRSRSWLVDPGVEIPAEASAVHGITTEQARAAGELPGDAVPAIVEALAQRPADSALVIFNAPFDLTVVDREARRYGVQPLADRGPLHVVDPLTIDKHLHRYRPGKRQLVPMCDHYRAWLDGDGHDADFDALLACRLAWVIGTKGRVVRRDEWEENPLQAEWLRIRADLPALHAAQVDWYAFQARGLAAHFRQKGKPDDADRVREDWPIIPERRTTNA